MPRTRPVAVALALCLPAVCRAGGPDSILTIGDPAPDLEVAHWLKGEPVRTFETGKCYVLEFWATWCAPCRVSMPRISELQQQLKDYDVTFIGISDEKLQTVVEFLAHADSEGVIWYDKVQYALATDPDRSAHEGYMKPAAQDGIPTAFIIGKDGRIDWIGSPFDMEEVLDKVVRGEWKRDAFKADFEERVAPAREMMRLMSHVNAAVERAEWDAAAAAVDDLVKSNPQYAYQRAKLFREMLRHADDPARIFGYGRTVMREHWDDATILNRIAWYTVDDQDVPYRDLDFALEAAERANALTDSGNASILDTLARVHYERNDLEAAIKWQRKAAEVADPPTAKELREVLIKYEKAAASRL